MGYTDLLRRHLILAVFRFYDLALHFFPSRDLL